jgi:hypothetical protein
MSSSELKNFKRIWLTDNVNKLPVQWQNFFKLMYGRDGGKRTVPETWNIDIEVVVKEIKDKQIDWAIQQVINSLEKMNRTLVDFGYPPKVYRKLM